jgi:hypothetical protein
MRAKKIMQLALYGYQAAVDATKSQKWEVEEAVL